MDAARSTVRATLARSIRIGRTPSPARARLQFSSHSSRRGHTFQRGNSHIAAGATGGLVVGIALYGLYLLTLSGETANKGAEDIRKRSQGSTPSEDVAVKYLKELAYSYVAWFPGGRGYVDSVFDDMETLKEKHRDEVNRIVKDAYLQFQELSQFGFSLNTASKAYDILARATERFGDLAGSALSDVLNCHPQAKERFGGSADQLRKMGENYGPEAKKLVNRTWQQANEILCGGVSASSLDEVRRLIEDKIQEVKKLGDEAWDEGMEDARPYLDKSPKVKELVEKNASTLKQGNINEVFMQAKKAAKSGDTGPFEDYVNQAKSKFGQAESLFGISQIIRVIPNGSNILGKVNQLRTVVEKRKDEGEKFLKDTTEELKQVFDKKSEKEKDAGEGEKKNTK
ncbi:hypothetical protein GGS21DRAFT_209041 [Xylaria nigripes]|nr:hypothetical protein GGS21DRAFT_209041 [Xylaria nigripes]